LVAKYIARSHPQEFHAAAEDEAGMIQMKSMGTNECEAMIQDGNLTMNQFNVVCQHVTFTASDSFKMTYRPSDIKKVEGSQTGPEPMFGMFKNESENGDIENCKHWSTLVSEELSSAVENDMMNTKDEASSFPEEVGIIIGMDHGQKAMCGYAKFLLRSLQLRK
jgi:hypothetical protein